MRVIKGITTTDTILSNSNILENEHPVWVASGSYTVGNRRIYNHKIYEALINHSGITSTPDTDKTRWLYISSTNRYRMFDNVISEYSSNTGTITFTLNPSQVVDSIVLLNVVAVSVRVVMTDPLEGIVYDNTVQLAGYGSISDYYTYFFASLGDNKTVAAFLNMPQRPAATITVTVDAGTGVAQVGEVAYGLQKEIGRTTYGTSIGIKSYSRKEVDEFGNVTVVKRKNSKFAEYEIDIDNYMLAEVQRFFADIDSVPSVFVGNPTMEELVVFGFYSDFRATISFPTVSKCTLRVEGLI